MLHLRVIAAAILCLTAITPASARRVRRSAPRPKPAAAAVAPKPSPDVARNVILFIADGYSSAEWRAARGDELLALDRFPVTGIALAPVGLEGPDAGALGRVLGTGQEPGDASTPVSLLGLARQYGKEIALVGGNSPAGPLLCGLALGGPWDESEAWRRLAEQRVGVLYGRALPDTVKLPADYAVATNADMLLSQERAPAAAAISGDNAPFETLVFRALHLAAKGPKGFLMAAAARPSEVPARAMDAAIASAVRYAERDQQTLVLVIGCRGESEILMHAYGPAAYKFGGVLRATDIPKIVAGVSGLKVFRRDFSPLFTARAVAQAPEPVVPMSRGKVIQPLPW